MFSAKRFSSLLLCAVVMLSTAVGCKDATDTDKVETTESEAVETVTEGTTESEVTTETEATTETTVPESEPNFEWVVEPGIFSGDIQPVQDHPVKRVNIGLVVADNKYLVDYNGDIKYTFIDNTGTQPTSRSICDACDVIYCAGGVIEPETYETVGNMGHGGYFLANFIYDSETGFICYRDYGGYAEVTENIPYAIVSEGVRRPATTEDNVMNDYAYDLTGRYGIVVNSKLVVPFEYDGAARYDDFGIAKLKKDGKWALFNSEGKAITGNDYLDFCAITDGYIAVNRDGKWGYIDLEGNVFIDHVFNDALPIYCGMAWVKTDDGWGVIKAYERELMTEEEAKQVIYDKFGNHPNLTNIDITPNDMSYYECIGYGFDVNISYSTGSTSSRRYFVNYDGTIYSPQYIKD